MLNCVVHPTDAVLVGLVLLLWAAVIALFCRRWGESTAASAA